MRFGERRVHREIVLSAMDTFEIIEEYPEDKYLPSYLVRAEYGALVLHVQVATDLPGDSIRIVTAYLPDFRKWEKDFRRRKL